MKITSSIELKFFAIFTISLGLFTYFISSRIIPKNNTTKNVNIKLLNAVEGEIQTIVANFEKGDNFTYRNIRSSFYQQINLLKFAMANYKDLRISQKNPFALLCFLFAAFSSIFYFFAGISALKSSKNTLIRLRFAIIFWFFTLLCIFNEVAIKYYLTKILFDYLSIMRLYTYPAGIFPQATLSFNFFSCLNPLLISIALVNIFLYIIFPFWYINRLEIKTLLK